MEMIEGCPYLYVQNICNAVWLRGLFGVGNQNVNCERCGTSWSTRLNAEKNHYQAGDRCMLFPNVPFDCCKFYNINCFCLLLGIQLYNKKNVQKVYGYVGHYLGLLSWYLVLLKLWAVRYQMTNITRGNFYFLS
jgi:hypothetical protein